jgi:hypothetical protein
MSKIETLIAECTIDSSVDYEKLIRNVIDECMFAFIVSVESKFNPITAKNILLEHFDLESEDDN